MKSRPWLTLSALLMLAVVGVITWQQTRRETRPAAPPVPPAYEARLQLAPEELEALRPVVSSAAADMTQFRREMRSQLSSTVRDLNAAIAEDLAGTAKPSPPPAPGPAAP